MLGRRPMLALSCACCTLSSVGSSLGQIPRSYVKRGNEGLIVCGSQPGSSGDFQPDLTLIRDKSGIIDLDNNINIETQTLDSFFGFSQSGGPEFAFYQDDREPIAARAVRGYYSACKIYLGLKLVTNEVRENPSRWRSVIIGILAHEWAHALQYRSYLDERLFMWETHADYMAGWYLGARQAMGTQSLDVDAFSNALFAHGSRPFNEDSYGLPEQRAAAVKAGYLFGIANIQNDRLPDVAEAAAAGYLAVGEMLRQQRRAPAQ
jgi:hypothetical protein